MNRLQADDSCDLSRLVFFEKIIIMKIINRMSSATNFDWRLKGKHTACWVIISADDILKYFSCFSKKTGLDFAC